jgi:hypothetical protein
MRARKPESRTRHFSLNKSHITGDEYLIGGRVPALPAPRIKVVDFHKLQNDAARVVMFLEDLVQILVFDNQ